MRNRRQARDSETPYAIATEAGIHNRLTCATGPDILTAGFLKGFYDDM